MAWKMFCPILDSPVPEWTKEAWVPGAVHCNFSSIWTVFFMEGELQSLLHRAALDSHWMWAALRGAHQEICVRSVFQEMQIVPAAVRSVLLGKEFPA